VCNCQLLKVNENESETQNNEKIITDHNCAGSKCSKISGHFNKTTNITISTKIVCHISCKTKAKRNKTRSYKTKPTVTRSHVRRCNSLYRWASDAGSWMNEYWIPVWLTDESAYRPLSAPQSRASILGGIGRAISHIFKSGGLTDWSFQQIRCAWIVSCMKSEVWFTVSDVGVRVLPPIVGG